LRNVGSFYTAIRREFQAIDVVDEVVIGLNLAEDTKTFIEGHRDVFEE
jgi:hypothetical protein